MKSLRAGKASLEGAFARIENGEVWLYRAEIPEYTQGSWTNHDPKRKRKLLLHNRQIAKLDAEVSQKGSTLIPLSLYFKGSRAKLELALAHGKKLYDKRQTLKEKDAKRQMSRAGRRSPRTRLTPPSTPSAASAARRAVRCRRCFVRGAVENRCRNRQISVASVQPTRAPTVQSER